MGGDPIPGPHDALRTWYMLPTLKKKEREEAIAKPETWHKKVERKRSVSTIEARLPNCLVIRMGRNLESCVGFLKFEDDS
ncbi:unnamed protein product [marine sediment metagenome]|uniref:Uncharacterized protein n=1 Tax=marine sediment metagenome TaxID=412755 RepID=X0SE39_9ZZZZ